MDCRQFRRSVFWLEPNIGKKVEGNNIHERFIRETGHLGWGWVGFDSLGFIVLVRLG
jgi:hypothetical protein